MAKQERTPCSEVFSARFIQNSAAKIANGPLTCVNAGRETPIRGLLNNPHVSRGTTPSSARKKWLVSAWLSRMAARTA